MRRIKPCPEPTELQRQVILGCLLGDAKYNRGVWIEHSPRDKPYVEWKYGFLSDLTNKAPHNVGKKKPMYGFYVRISSFIREVRELGPHPLTEEFLALINHPIALAV